MAPDLAGAQLELAAAREALAAAEQSLAARLLAEDPATVAAELRDARERVDRLQAAADALVTEEERRLVEQRAKQARTTLRCARAHRGQFAAAVDKIEATVAELATVMQQAGASFDAAYQQFPAEFSNAEVPEWPFWWKDVWDGDGSSLISRELSRRATDCLHGRPEPLAHYVDLLDALLAAGVAALAAALPADTPIEDDPDAAAAAD